MLPLIQNEVVNGAHRIPVIADALFDNINKSDFDAVVLPGGMPGSLNLYNDERVINLLYDFAGENKVTAAICAAPMVLGKRGYLEGKRAICFPGFEEYLTGAEIATERVVRDGKLITAAGMGVAVEFGLALVAALKGQETADALRRAVLAD